MLLSKGSNPGHDQQEEVIVQLDGTYLEYPCRQPLIDPAVVPGVCNSRVYSDHVPIISKDVSEW